LSRPNTNFVRSWATRLTVRAGRCRSPNRVFLLTHALATPSMQHTLSLRATSARALCGRARGWRTGRHEKPLHPLRSTRHERQAMRPPLRNYIPRQTLIRCNTFSVRQRMRHEQKSWHPNKTSASLRGPWMGASSRTNSGHHGARPSACRTSRRRPRGRVHSRSRRRSARLKAIGYQRPAPRFSYATPHLRSKRHLDDQRASLTKNSATWSSPSAAAAAPSRRR
jgi:hypothetical protein